MVTSQTSSILAGRTVVVSGAGRGLGRAIAEACARHGARLVVCDILEELGRQTAADLAASGAQARFLPVDLADPTAIEAFSADLRRHEHTIHGLVNNAAVTNTGGKRFDELSVDAWDRVMGVNVRGTWLMTRALVPLFPERDGRIVNIASDTPLWGSPGLLAYVASKGAVISMTHSLARELGPKGIGVAAVAPGIMRTEGTEYVPVDRFRAYELGRAVPGPQTPEDIVEVVTFLLTPAALALTGQLLPTNAGFVFA